jgi:hypothetical protein
MVTLTPFSSTSKQKTTFNSPLKELRIRTKVNTTVYSYIRDENKVGGPPLPQGPRLESRLLQSGSLQFLSKTPGKRCFAQEPRMPIL